MSCDSFDPGSGRSCERNAGPHQFHSAYDSVSSHFIDWPNSNYVPHAPRKATREQQDARTRKTLRDMSTRTKEAAPKAKFYPTENDRLGRAALYLRKYKSKWVSLEELELKTIAGSAAQTSVNTLINRYGWEIKVKLQVKDDRRFFMLVSEQGPVAGLPSA